MSGKRGEEKEGWHEQGQDAPGEVWGVRCAQSQVSGGPLRTGCLCECQLV